MTGYAQLGPSVQGFCRAISSCMPLAVMGLGDGRHCRAVVPMRPAGRGIRVESRSVDWPCRDRTIARNLRDELRVPKAKLRLYLGRYQALAQPTRRARDLRHDAPLPLTYAKRSHQSVVPASAVVCRLAFPQSYPRQSQRGSRPRVRAKNLCGEIPR